MNWPEYESDGARIINGDCLEVMPALAAGSVDAIVTDPPYGLNFMGKAWDHGVPGPEFWTAAKRVIRPGGFMFAFGGSRTFHRLACAIEDAGWEIRDTLSWHYGTGFPKSKACLKPGWEPIILAKAPGKLRELEIDACRIGTTVETWPASRSYGTKAKKFNTSAEQESRTQRTGSAPLGRYPANVIFSHHIECGDECVDDCVVKVLGEQSGETAKNGKMTIGGKPRANLGVMAERYNSKQARDRDAAIMDYGDSGTAARFYSTFRHDLLESTLRDLLWGYELHIIDMYQQGAYQWQHANDAVLSSSRTRPTIGNTAGKSARLSQAELSDQTASDAESRFGLRETLTAQGHARVPIRNTIDLKARFTSATENELRLISDLLTATIQNFGSEFSRGRQPERLSLSLSHANSVAVREQTGTIAITIDRWKSDGSAGSATFACTPTRSGHGEVGYPARFNYTPKASRSERGEGNSHPTVKPRAVIDWLIKLISKQGDTILDPFAGSGTTALSAISLGRKAICIDRDPGYFEIATDRLKSAQLPLLAKA